MGALDSFFLKQHAVSHQIVAEPSDSEFRYSFPFSVSFLVTGRGLMTTKALQVCISMKANVDIVDKIENVGSENVYIDILVEILKLVFEYFQLTQSNTDLLSKLNIYINLNLILQTMYSDVFFEHSVWEIQK